MTGQTGDEGRSRFPAHLCNATSAAGVLLVLFAGVPFLCLLVLELRRSLVNPYTGLLLYMVFPPFVLLGLLLIPLGAFRSWRSRPSEPARVRWPSLDLNRPNHRNAFLVFAVGTLVLLTLGIVGLSQAYQFTESVKFCGQVCHAVMEPEHTAYQASAHARVRCTACHVGPGAGWYARSKISGLYQVYSVLFDKYPRPIDTPVRNLRPAQETCEECHWPDKFFGGQERRFDHFLYDAASTPWPIEMIVKTGGGDPLTGNATGIHWHTNRNVRIEYIARDSERQDLPWVRVTDHSTGRVCVYESQDDPFPADSARARTPRVMDCMDCHNRPAHRFQSPDAIIDASIAAGRIDRALPDVKRVCVEAMAADYETKEAARTGIANAIGGFYEEQHADLPPAARATVDSTIVATRSVYATNVFPAMKASWKRYPDNIGHFAYPGCMRCHDGRHVSETGEAISNDCSTCHVIVLQGSGTLKETATLEAGLTFQHPEDIGDAWQDTGCFECHQGVQP